MDTDPYLTKLVAWTVCIIAAAMVGTLCWQVVEGYEADKNLHDLTYLIVGALVSQITTHAVAKVKDGIQNVQVPAPLVPADALAAPAEPAATPDTVVDIHPDAPEESDL